MHDPTTPALSPEEYERRERAYAEMARLLEPLGRRAVLVVFEGDSFDAHVSVHVPGDDDPRRVLLTGQHGLYALSLYTQVLEQRLEAARDEGAQS